jgi:glycosyltransferase involved in cell wall biosynthesis
MSSRLRICIDARHATSNSGGTATLTLSLARALLKLSDGEEQYVFLVKPGDGPNLEQQLHHTIHFIESAPFDPPLAYKLAARVPGIRSLGRRLRRALRRREGTVDSEAAISGHMITETEIDVIHFTAPSGFQTDIPFVYQPHDLQHRHLPDFFTARERSDREYNYSTLCQQAAAVCVVSEWGKQDLIDSFRLPESKVHIVHYAPELYIGSENPAEVARALAEKLLLPGRFVFYPARTWPHKNHLRLLRALRLLRDREGLIVPLVCSGGLTPFCETLKAECQLLGLSEQVRFIGFVDFKELSALYSLCAAVVIPTLFEAASFPLWESFLSKRPAACSNVTSLPRQAGDAALIFDPYNVNEIADAVMRLWTDSKLGEALVQRACMNVSRYGWDTTARTFRAIYRLLGKRQLTTEDKHLLAATPLM